MKKTVWSLVVVIAILSLNLYGSSYDDMFSEMENDLEYLDASHMFEHRTTFSSGVHASRKVKDSLKSDLDEFWKSVKLAISGGKKVRSVEFIFSGSSDNAKKDGIDKKLLKYRGDFGNISAKALFNNREKRLHIKKSSYISNLELAMVRAYSIFHLVKSKYKHTPLAVEKAQISFKLNLTQSENKNDRYADVNIIVSVE
jgi:hypothetical protein